MPRRVLRHISQPISGFSALPFHPVLSVIVHISDVWSSQCPIYENIVIQGETSNTRRLAKIGKGKLQMKWSSSSSITVNETEFSPCYIALKKRELTNNIGRCVTKRDTDYLAPRANHLARLSKFYISGPIMTYY